MAARDFAVCVIALPLLVHTGCGQPSAASPIAANSPTDSSPADSSPASNSPADSLPAHSPIPPPDGHSASDEPAASGGQSHAQASQAAAPASEPATPAPQRPPADRAKTKPGEAEKVTFEVLNLGMQADVVFRPFMVSDRVKDLEGKRISIVGYMHGGQAGQRGIKEFILLKNTQCKFGPGGQADHLADVKLKSDSPVQFTPSPIKVEGTLVLEPFQGPDGNTWSIYRLESAQVKN